MSQDLTIAGVILVGGKSSRMGQPKADLILPDGRTMLEHVEDTLTPYCDIVYYSVSDETADRYPEDRALVDNYRNIGPLSGLEAALSSELADGYLFVGCDQPHITGELYERLLTGRLTKPACFRKSGEQYLNPFPGYYPASLLPIVEEMIELKRHSIQRIFSETPSHIIELSYAEADRIVSFNTPQQYKKLR